MGARGARLDPKPLTNESKLCSKCRKETRQHATHSWGPKCRNGVRRDKRLEAKAKKPVVAVMRQGDVTAIVHGDRPLTEEERGMMGAILDAVVKAFPSEK